MSSKTGLEEMLASVGEKDIERRTEELIAAWLDFIEIQREEQIAAGRLCEAVDLEVSRFEAVVRARERIKVSLDKILDPLGSREAALDELRSQAPEPEWSQTGMTSTIQERAAGLLRLFERGES